MYSLTIGWDTYCPSTDPCGTPLVTTASPLRLYELIDFMNCLDAEGEGVEREQGGESGEGGEEEGKEGERPPERRRKDIWRRHFGGGRIVFFCYFQNFILPTLGWKRQSQ